MADGQPAGRADLDWEWVSPADWVATVGSYPWEEWRGGGELLGERRIGRCPRCRHVIAAEAPFVYGLMGPPMVKYPEATSCNCLGVHPERKAEYTSGCGAHGPI